MLEDKSKITLKNVTFSRGSRVVFDQINLSVPEGKITAIMGPSGIGKTTLLKLIGGQIQPDSGDIWFEQNNIPALSRSQLFQVRKKMSMLFQSGALFTDLTVFENVAFPIREHTDLSESFIRTIVLLKLEAVGLRGAAELMPSELSGGMTRRVALARAIALDPEVVMYDEPFVGQDPITMGVLVELIKKLNQALGITSIVVSHDVPEVMSIADYVYLVAEQKVIASGTPAQIEQSDDPRVLQFLKGHADGAVPFAFPSSSLEKDLFQS
ncbi:ABC transporter ATP-binding protein [Vibrio sp. UCD-FRSSP16_10]|uniref:phospholipid ABC transporter ATP-binding protein MlaF n=1 Tax=unclassified Vibrio TaxID=2614977 RepID=UPI0007FD5138|nr:MULTISPECIES: phospholipid ABC transporter ATP-binding protein MlaF [unclassified Vibrio]OBT17414.1 ABC transporter ATP-binding protein [Vibrio sp. UCD-FRSSP16_30]OBT23183.1 ABC transporter ATP-binding protein [Vibrio sp. UCD-FRSSP16_10]